MQKKEDLRVHRTKKALADTFMQMLEKKPLDEITINDLCDQAGIRRATFYKHYSDKFDFITSYISFLRDTFDRNYPKSSNQITAVEYYVDYAKQLVVYINDHSVAIDNLLQSNMFPLVMAIIIEQNYIDTCNRLRMSVQNGMKLSASVEIVASMCAGGVAETVYQWLKRGRDISPNELANQIGAVVSAALSVSA